METCQRNDFIDDLKRNQHPIIRLPAGLACSSDCLPYSCRRPGNSSGCGSVTSQGLYFGAMPKNTIH